MKVIAASTDPLDGGSRGSHREPGMLLDSCRNLGLSPIVVGLGEGEGLSRPEIQKRKIVWLRESLPGIPDDELVVLTDGWDVCFIAGEDRIREGFKSYGTDILFSAEKNLWPSAIGKCGIPYPESPTPWRYLNAGGVCGCASVLRALLADDAFTDKALEKWRCDQDAYHDYHLRNPGTIQLDHYCRVFQTLFLGAPLRLVNSRIQNLQTKTYPCVLHGNGGTAPEAMRLWKQLKRQST